MINQFPYFRNNINKEAILQELKDAQRLEALQEAYEPNMAIDDEEFYSNTLDSADKPYHNQYPDQTRYPSDAMLLQRLVSQFNVVH